MKKWSKVLICCLVVIIICLLLGLAAIHLPLWIYRCGNDYAVEINNAKDDIAFHCEMKKEDLRELLEQLLYENPSQMKDVKKHVDFQYCRETPKGYYSILESSDKYRVFCFFDFSLSFRSYLIIKDHFINSEEAEESIQIVDWLPEKGVFDTDIPYWRLDTGAEYVAYYFQNGIIIALYNMENDGISIPGKERYTCTMTRMQTLSYHDLFIQPGYWMKPFNSLPYILTKDRS